MARIISLLPEFGYELVCPLFDGAIVRPISPDACIEGVKAAISDSYGVEIRSRDACRFAVDEGRPADSAAPTLRHEADMIYENTYSGGDHAAANAKMACVKDKESGQPLLDSVSSCHPRETESDGATSAIDHDPGLMEVSTPPRPDAYGVSDTCDVGPPSTI